MCNRGYTERKFSREELRRIGSKSYLSGRCVRMKVIEGIRCDFALFSASFGPGPVPSHTIGVTPVVEDGSGVSCLKVVVTAMRYGRGAFGAAGVLSPSVMFVVRGTVCEAVRRGTGVARAQWALLSALPEGAVRVGRVPGTTVRGGCPVRGDPRGHRSGVNNPAKEARK